MSICLTLPRNTAPYLPMKILWCWPIKIPTLTNPPSIIRGSFKRYYYSNILITSLATDCWLFERQITDFLGALQCDLPKVSPSSLESVFGQCMYFGLSFGRIGSDFRSLLVPLFSQVVYDRFDHSANKSEAQFAEAMASFSLTRTGSFGSSASYSYIQTPPSSADQVQPPYALMKFSPVAELCNGLIAAFNELRMCAPVQLVDPVARKLERTLCNCSQIMADFHRQEKGAFTVNEELEFTKCLQLYRNEFLSYVQKILQLMFSPALISAQTGFPTGEIVKQEVCCLNKSLILTPIDHLLAKEEPLILPELALIPTSSSSLTADQPVQEPEATTESIQPSNSDRPMDNGTLDEEILPATDAVVTGFEDEIKLEPVSEPEVETQPETETADQVAPELDPVDNNDLEAKPEQETEDQQVIESTECPSEMPILPETNVESNVEFKPELASDILVETDSTDNRDALQVTNQDSALELAESVVEPVVPLHSEENDELNQLTSGNDNEEFVS